MSNIVTGNPLIIDTAAGTAVTSYVFTATKIRWVGATTAGHTVTIQDKGGAVKFAAAAATTNYDESESFDPPLIFDGLIVPTLSSGTVYIYISSSVPTKT